MSGGNTITLSASATGSNLGESVTVYNDLYRMIGALYTASLTSVVQFTQDSNTFYLAVPVLDVNTNSGGPCMGTVMNVDKICALSVPCGRNATCTSGAIKVEAFGRMLAGTSNKVLISSKDSSPGPVPGTFATVPGYSTGNSQGDTAYPFRLYTDTSGRIRLRGSSSTGATAFADTDGWVLQR